MSHAPSEGHHHAHHFQSAEHEFESAKQGMWIFLVTEVLMLGGLFVAYFVFRGLYIEAYHEAHHHLDWKLGALNTLILIISSVTMLLGVAAAQRGENKKTANWMLMTIALACGFLVVKYIEYSHKIHDGLLPGGLFNNPALTHPKTPLFFSIYFAATGLHGLHVIVGIALIFWIYLRAKKNEFSAGFYTPVELVGFYWHFVDLVWIYLFPLLYLVS